MMEKMIDSNNTSINHLSSINDLAEENGKFARIHNEFQFKYCKSALSKKKAQKAEESGVERPRLRAS